MLVCKNWLFKALYLRWVFTTDGLIPLMITVSCASLILNSAELTASELPEQYWMYCNGVCNLDEKVADESCVEKRASKIHGTYLGHVFFITWSILVSPKIISRLSFHLNREDHLLKNTIYNYFYNKQNCNICTIGSF